MYRRRFTTLLLLALAAAGCDAPTLRSTPVVKKPATKTAPVVVSFGNDYAAALDTATREQKPLLIFFTADWCEYCRQIRHDIFERPEFVEAAKRFVCVEVDAGRQPTIGEEYRVRAYPTLVVANPAGKAIERIVGVTTPTVVLSHMNAAATAIVAAREEPAEATLKR